MKKYRITKIVKAKDLLDAARKEHDAEMVQIDLQDELDQDSIKGFHGKN